MRQVAVSLPIFRCVIANEYFGQIVFTVEETAARREAEQLRVLQYRSTETVEETAARREAEQLHVSQSRSTFYFYYVLLFKKKLFTQPYSLRKGETKPQKGVGAMC